MPYPSTESRLPFSFQPFDLGDAVVDVQNKVALISYYTSPLTQTRQQTYVLLITDNVTQNNFHSVRWQAGNFDETNQDTILHRTYNQTGPVTLNVTVLDSGGSELARVTLNQTVTPLNVALENLIQLDDATHPVADDPATSREIINDLLPLLHNVVDVSTHETEHKLLFSVSYANALSHPKTDREQLINTLRGHINNSRSADFFTDAAPGAGICRLRTEILAMTLPAPANPIVPWQLLPADSAQRTTALTTLRSTLAGLTEANQIDLFNVLRFPKASLKALDLVIGNIRTKLFSGNSLDTIMGNSTNADQLFNHLIHGPNAPNSTLPANPVSPNGIIARMVGPLWSQIGRIAPVIPTTTGSAIAGTVPSLFGIPERIPEATYIVNALPNDNGFISQANTYHQTYNLNPQPFTSLQGLAQALAGSSSHINRLRIVGHAGLNPSNEANLFAAFFNGGPRVITGAMLRGFGTSDEQGLRSVLDTTGFANPTAPVYTNHVDHLLSVLNNLHPEVMVPFGTVTTASLSGDFRLLMFYASDLLFANLGTITANGANISTANRNHLKASLRLLYNFVRDRVAGTTVSTGSRAVTVGELDTLRTTVEAYTTLQVACFCRGPFPILNSLVNRILTALRGISAHNALLQKFCLQTNGPTSGTSLDTFLKICSDLLYVRLLPVNDLKLHGTPLSAPQRTQLNTALNSAADKRKNQMANTRICPGAPADVTAADIDALKAAILALSMNDINMLSLAWQDFASPIGSSAYTATTGRDENNDGVDDPAPVRIFDILNSTNGAIGINWRQHLTTVKNRFDENSWVDIRGCRIGQDTSYLDAIRAFFGRSGHAPSVSGPDLYQSFATTRGVLLANEAAIDQLFGNGMNSEHHNAQQIKDRFVRVAPLSGVDIHINFWKNVSDLGNFDFVAMLWKGNLQPLPMVAPKLSDFDSLSFTETINRIASIFNLNASLPTGGTLTRIQNAHAAITALKTEMTNIQLLAGQASPAAAELTASHSRLNTVSTSLGQTTVPAAAPAGLTAAQLNTWAGTLKTHVETAVIGGGSNNTEINTFRQALHTKVRVPLASDNNALGNGRADFRYYFAIGLALFVEPLTHRTFYALDVNFPGNNPMETAAIRLFMKAHWQDELPAGNLVAASTFNQSRSKQVSVLVDKDAANTITASHSNPYPEFNQHIITRP